MTIPDHWLLELGSAEAERTFATLYGVIAEQDKSPFIAAGLVRETVSRVLQKRDPSTDYGLVLPPMPLKLSDLTATPDTFLAEMFPVERSGGPTSHDATLDDLVPDWRKALDSGALRPVERVAFWSPLFTVEQLERSRVIFDLRRFNENFGEQHFEMETLAHVPLIAAGAKFASKLDLSSAFWQYPVDASLATFFGTSSPEDRVRSALYQWHCLPLGFTRSPLLFSSLTSAFVRAWRAAGLRVLAYIDDFLVLADTPEELAAATQIVVSDLIAAGLRLSPKKCFLGAFTRIDFLGLTTDLTEQAFAIPPRKLAQIAEGARSLLASGPTRQETEVLVGRIAFASIACPWLCYFRAAIVADALASDPHPPQTLTCPRPSPAPDPQAPQTLTHALPPATTTDAAVEWSNDATTELRWWAEESQGFLSGRMWPWHRTAHTKLFARARGGEVPLPDFVGATDASDTGIGLRLPSGVLDSEPLPPELPPSSPSVARELYAILRLIELDLIPPDTTIRVTSDSTGAVQTVLGSTVAPSTAWVARRLFYAMVSKQVTVQVEWLPRALLDDVDAYSRLDASNAAHSVLTEAEREHVCREAFGKGAKPDVIFFSSVHTRWAPAARFGSRGLEPGSIGDGIASDAWGTAERGWAYPPFALATAVVRRVVAATSPPKAVLVLPRRPIFRSALRGWRLLELSGEVLQPPTFAGQAKAALPLDAFISPALITGPPVE